MTVVREDPELVPVCPHCEGTLDELIASEVPARGGSASFRWGKRYVYACPHCDKALGVSHRKGFWAG